MCEENFKQKVKTVIKMKSQLNFRQHTICAKQAGGMLSYWSVNSLSFDRTPNEITVGFREGAGYA